MRVIQKSECISRWVYAAAFGTVAGTVVAMCKEFGPVFMRGFTFEWLMIFVSIGIGFMYPFVRKPHLVFRVISASLIGFVAYVTFTIFIIQIAALVSIFLTFVNWRAVYSRDGLKESVSTWYGKVTWEEHIGDSDGSTQIFY